MITQPADMTDTEDNQELRGIACPRCGCRRLGFSFRDPRTGVIKWGHIRHTATLTIRVKLCQHCGRQVISHEKLAGKPDED